MKELLKSRYDGLTLADAPAASAPVIREIVEAELQSCLRCSSGIMERSGISCSACPGCDSPTGRHIVFSELDRGGFWCPKGTWDRIMGPVILLRRGEYREESASLFVAGLESRGVKVYAHETPDTMRQWKDLLCELGRMPAAVIAWDEHAEIVANPRWKAVVQDCYKRGITPCFLDYGYFDHYSTFVVAPYAGADCRSRIADDWEALDSTEQRWGKADPRLRKYRAYILKQGSAARALPSLVEPPYVVVWAQFCSTLARPAFKHGDKHQWLERVCEQVAAAGFRPVVKECPLPDGPKTPAGVRSFGRVNNVANQFINARLAVHAANNIIVCSSVSNELVLHEVPVTALGKSWFAGLGVFHEPESWDQIASPAPVDEKARTRWVNWWLSRQGYADQMGLRVRMMAAEEYDYKGQWTAVYQDNPAAAERSPQTTEVVTCLLRPLLTDRSALVLDVGSGNGEIVDWLTAQGIEAKGIDVAYVPAPRADLSHEAFRLGDVRALPYRDLAFDVAVVAGVLEHLNEWDIPASLRQLRRVAKTMVAVIEKGDGQATIAGFSVTETRNSGKWWRASFESAGWRIRDARETTTEYMVVAF